VKKLSKLVNDWPLLSLLQWLDGCDFGCRRVPLVAAVRCSKRLPPIPSQA
jgi:hypothetical protein